ncbi:glutaminyl-peptide cyclotransferase [Flavobacteriaceae bacterium A100]|uniref:glutaminyl-peptide cyclotransferase n=1 Tax=Oceanihabitans sediminis TaxID=1812012 RepID=UPI000930333C
MKTNKALIVIFLATLIFSCGSNINEKKKDFSVSTNAKNNAIALGETLNITLENPKNHPVESVTYTLNGKEISESTPITDIKLGEHTLVANLNFDGTAHSISQKLTVLNNTAPTVYTYKIINEYPHDITSYTQGLEFYNGELYESTGQRGESKLRKVDYKTGEVLKNIDLEDAFFGEGLTVLKDKIYQLTWTSGTGFVYDVETFEKLESFKYNKSKEGWGICNDGKTLYKSDGSEKIWTLNPETLAEENYIQAYHHAGKVIGINELEWVEGKIYANRYQKNGVAIINPTNGAIEGVIDFSPLKNKVKQHAGLDVLNGIAYNPETKTLFITGKRWDKLFEVEIFEK